MIHPSQIDAKEMPCKSTSTAAHCLRVHKRGSSIPIPYFEFVKLTSNFSKRAKITGHDVSKSGVLCVLTSSKFNLTIQENEASHFEAEALVSFMYINTPSSPATSNRCAWPYAHEQVSMSAIPVWVASSRVPPSAIISKHEGGMSKSDWQGDLKRCFCDGSDTGAKGNKEDVTQLSLKVQGQFRIESQSS